MPHLAAHLTILCLGTAVLLAGCTQTQAVGPPAPAVATATATVVRTDVASRQTVQGTIGYAATLTVFAPGGSSGGSSSLSAGGVYTWLAPVGSAVRRGQRLYEVSGRPIPVFYGERPMWRRLAIGVSGPDVQQLEDNLLALGFTSGGNLVADGSFGAADAAAVRRWQASLGIEQTGAVDPGDLVFVPGAVRVSALRVTAGAPAQAGGAVLDASSTQKEVSVQLDTVYEQLVAPGDPVIVTLPDGRSTTQGTVTAVSSIASTPSNQGGQSGQGSPASRPTVPVQIAVADQAALARYDQAPVRVSITDTVRRGVLAVPVTALLAQGDGGYAVRVMRGSTGSLVRVDVGIFGDNGLVEVSGQSLEAGVRVQVPRE